MELRYITADKVVPSPASSPVPSPLSPYLERSLSSSLSCVSIPLVPRCVSISTRCHLFVMASILLF